jgi:hypothetical protein
MKYRHEWEEALDQCDAIISMIDYDVPEQAFEAASKFFESVRENVLHVADMIEKKENVTDGQLTALDNWEAGVGKWIKE